MICTRPPSLQLNEMPFDVPDMYAKPGTPCNDYKGYCDVFQKCREVSLMCIQAWDTKTRFREVL